MLVPRIILTISAFLFGVAPLLVDLSTSHVFNADWPPHARFHIVWLLGMLAMAGVVTVIGAWTVNPGQKLYMKLTTLPGWLVLVPFFVAALLIETYGGSLSGLPNSPKVFGLDGNVVLFSVSAVFQGSASVMVWRR